MHAFRHSSAESRLCRLTIDELNKQRAAAGAVAAIPLNKRAAEANAAVQNQPTKNTGSAVTDPAAASMQRLRDTQAYLAENPSVDPTGSIGKQALEGQAMAETYVAPRNLGNEQYYKDQANFLQDYTATKSNAADGFASSIDQGVSEVKDPITGEIKYVRTQGNVQTASMSQIQQSAIGNLRKAGKTDEEIKATLDDPTYLQNIAQTMSNTGLGGTARQSAVLTPAQAQSVLATSRNPNERKAAQDALDAAATQGVSQTVEKQVGTDKNGNPIYMTQTNPNYEAEVEAKRQRMAQEQANKLKVQESEKKMKEFTAGVDTTALTETQKQISGIMESIKGLSPALQSAVLPNLLSLQQSNNEALTMAQTMVNALPTDQEIEAQYGTIEKYILSQSSKYEDLLKKNKDTQIEVAEYNKEMLEIDKKILEHDADVAEQKQAQANIENEKKLRRQLNKLGIQTDVQGLSFLNSEIQKGVDALENMKTANNLVSLKANLAISKGYSLEVKGILNDYEGKYLEITSKTTEALNSVRSSISKDKSERDKEMRSILEKASEKKAANDKEARSMIYNANVKMIDEVGKARDDERAQEQLGWQRLEKAITTYGSNVPKSLLDSIGKMLPNVDVSDVSKAMTLAQAKKSKSGGASSGYIGFSNSQRGADGKAITLDQFIAQKQQDFNKTQSGPASPEQKKAWEKEYSASAAQESILSANGIMQDWRIKQAQAGNFPSVAQMEATELNIANAIKSGNFQEARNIVDNIGSRPPEKTIAQVTSIERVLNSLEEMTMLVDRIESNIGPFPTEGALWAFVNENIETSPDYQRMKQLRDSNLSSYSRGVSGEKGATTEGDVQRVLSSLIDENVSADALRAGLEQAKKQAHMSINLYLKGMRDGGFRVNGLQDTYDSGSWKTSEDADLSPEQQSFLDQF